MPLKMLWVKEETRHELLREAQRRDRKVNGSLADEVIMTGLQCLSDDNREENGFHKKYRDSSSSSGSSVTYDNE